MRWRGALVLLVLTFGVAQGPVSVMPEETHPLHAPAPAGATPATPDAVWVRVSDAEGPVENATVYWTLDLAVEQDAMPWFVQMRNETTVTTDQNGYAELPEGSGQIRVDAAGYRPYLGSPGEVTLHPPQGAQAIAHRGASKYAPENTLAAFELARAIGADRVEVDLRMSRDGYMVAMHDATVDRTTDRAGPVAAYSQHELVAMGAGGWFHSDYQEARIPSLGEILQWAHGNETRLLLEIKEEPPREAQAMQATLAALDGHWGLVADVEIASFSPLSAHSCLGTLWRCGWILPTEPDQRDDGLALASNLNIPFIIVPVRFVDEGFVARAHDAGVEVYVYTANKAETIARLTATGVDAILTDRPERMVYG